MQSTFSRRAFVTGLGMLMIPLLAVAQEKKADEEKKKKAEEKKKKAGEKKDEAKEKAEDTVDGNVVDGPGTDRSQDRRQDRRRDEGK